VHKDVHTRPPRDETEDAMRVLKEEHEGRRPPPKPQEDKTTPVFTDWAAI